MAYTLKQATTQFKSGKNILASEHVQYIAGGATLDGKKFPEGVIEVGTIITYNDKTGKYEPLDNTRYKNEAYTDFAILNEDHLHDGKTDAVTGAVIIEGSVYLEKLPYENDVLQTYAQYVQALNPNIHFVKQFKNPGEQQ